MIDAALRAFPDEPDLRFYLAFCWLHLKRRWKFRALLRRLSREDPVGATVLEALAGKNNTIIKRCLADCVARC